MINCNSCKESTAVNSLSEETLWKSNRTFRKISAGKECSVRPASLTTIHHSIPELYIQGKNDAVKHCISKNAGRLKHFPTLASSRVESRPFSDLEIRGELGGLCGTSLRQVMNCYSSSLLFKNKSSETHRTPSKCLKASFNAPSKQFSITQRKSIFKGSPNKHKLITGTNITDQFKISSIVAVGEAFYRKKARRLKKETKVPVTKVEEETKNSYRQSEPYIILRPAKALLLAHQNETEGIITFRKSIPQESVIASNPLWLNKLDYSGSHGNDTKGTAHRLAHKNITKPIIQKHEIQSLSRFSLFSKKMAG